jgi:hypothetical protein
METAVRVVASLGAGLWLLLVTALSVAGVDVVLAIAGATLAVGLLCGVAISAVLVLTLVGAVTVGSVSAVTVLAREVMSERR